MKKVVLSVVVMSAFAFVSPNVAQAVASCSSDYNGQGFTDKPEVSSSLCATGTPSGTIEGDGSEGSPWKWHCYDENGNQGERCEAFVQEEEAAPVSCELSASENEIEGSGSTTLNWDAQNADSVEVHPCSSVDNSFKSAGPNGSHYISGIDSSRCYAVTAYGAGGSAMCTVDITVTEKEEEHTYCSITYPGRVMVDADGNGWGDTESDEAGCMMDPVSEEKEDEVDTNSDAEGEVVDTSVDTEQALEQEVAVSVNSDEDEDDNDSFAPAASCSEDDYSDIKGHIWHDDNRNGIKDSGESYIEDVTVELLDEDGNEIEEDKTDDDGEFKFRNYAPGKYIIDVKNSDSDLEGMHVVYEPDNNLNGKDRMTLKCDNDHTGTDFGYDDGEAVSTNRPSTLSQTGGSFWSALKAFFLN